MIQRVVLIAVFGVGTSCWSSAGGKTEIECSRQRLQSSHPNY